MVNWIRNRCYTCYNLDRKGTETLQSEHPLTAQAAKISVAVVMSYASRVINPQADNATRTVKRDLAQGSSVQQPCERSGRAENRGLSRHHANDAGDWQAAFRFTIDVEEEVSLGKSLVKHSPRQSKPTIIMMAVTTPMKIPYQEKWIVTPALS